MTAHNQALATAGEALSESDGEELRATLRDYLAINANEAVLRENIANGAGYDRELWKRLAGEIGVQGVGIAAEHGGAGFGLAAVALVQHELGRVLYNGPYFSTVVLASRLLERGEGCEHREEWLAQIADGSLTATVALREGTGPIDLAKSNARAYEVDGQWRVSGSKSFVIDGAGSDIVLVPAMSDAGVAIFAVRSDDLVAEQLSVFDTTRALADVHFTDAAAEHVIGAADAVYALEAVLAEASALLGAEQVGAAEHVLEFTVKYTTERYQFGRPIGSFQAVKHHAANMLLALEGARSTTEAAIEQLAAGSELVPAIDDVAGALASDAFVGIAEKAIQLHGGMGITWEHQAHLYLKRAKADAVLLRSSRERRRRIAARLEL